MLEVENLKFAYDNNLPILDKISFKVEEGALCGLLGPNGSGKTTLFKCIMGFLHYNSGTIRIDKDDIRDKTIKQLSKLVAYVPQEHKAVFPFLVKDVVMMGRTPNLKNSFGPSKIDKIKTIQVMDTLGITKFANEQYNKLSGGQRQLVIIARALVQDTKLILMDEPTSALDFNNQIKIWQLLKQISKEGKTVVACTHDPNHVSWFCDKAIAMGRKHLIDSGSVEKVITEEVLEKMYGNICKVKKIDDLKFVYPLNLI